MAKQTLNNGESGSSFRGKLNANFTELYEGRSVVVAGATGVATTDTAAINAAFTAAGDGGVVLFPPKQSYVVCRRPGAVGVSPRIVNGNGSVITLRDEVATTIASGTYNAGDTVIVLTDASGFVAGDDLVLASGTNTFKPCRIQSISVNTVTLLSPGLVQSSGGSVTAGATASASDICLYFLPTTDDDIEVSGFIFDGNSANRATNLRYQNSPMLYIDAAIAGDEPSAWIHNNTFRNGPCDAVVTNSMPFVKLTDNHFYNIKGSGFHPGGSTDSHDLICSNNTFDNVFQFTGATTPTLVQYGHIAGHGAMVTSLGPVRYVVSGNVVKTSTGYGWDGLNNAGNVGVTLSNNIFEDCAHGGFRGESADGSRMVITGNILRNCGQGGSADTGSASEYTKLAGNTAADVVITGNLFVNTTLNLMLSTSQVLVSGNRFNAVTKAANTEEAAALQIAYTGTTPNEEILITGNSFRGPRTSAELAAVGGAPLAAIVMGIISNTTISGNSITGFKQGIAFSLNQAIRGVTISGNTLLDQITSSSAARGIYVNGTTPVISSLCITGNSVSRLNDTTGDWRGIEVNAATTQSGVLISGNVIDLGVRPATNRIGMNFGSNTGVGMVVSNNVIDMDLTGDTAISGSSMTSSATFLNNIIPVGTQNIGDATTTGSIKQAITSAGAIKLNANYVTLSVASGTYAVTLAAPATGQQGQTKVIEMIGNTGTSVTLALTNVIGGSAGATATFDAVNETLSLVAAAGKWMVTGEGGVTLS